MSVAATSDLATVWVVAAPLNNYEFSVYESTDGTLFVSVCVCVCVCVIPLIRKFTPYTHLTHSLAHVLAY